MKAVRWAAAFVGLGAIVACSGAADGEDAVRASEQAIVGGVDDDADPAVVAVRYWFVDACTGTLIAPHTVLTAAHCTKNIAEDFWLDKTLEVDFGPKSGGSRKIDVASHAEHPKFTKAGVGYDIAILTLADAVDDVTPVPIAMAPAPDLTGVTVRHVGYGENDEDNESGQGRKRQASYPVTRVEPLLYWSGGPSAQTCEGDSGGPMLWRDPGGTERIVAVVSDGPNCHDEGADARIDVDEIRDWIVGQVQKNDPGFVLPGSDGDAGAGDAGTNPADGSVDAGGDDAPDASTEDASTGSPSDGDDAGNATMPDDGAHTEPDGADPETSGGCATTGASRGSTGLGFLGGALAVATALRRRRRSSARERKS